ncbi:hypothetical protein ACWD25_14155 [Streptomyces sp. NPDC002920]
MILAACFVLAALAALLGLALVDARTVPPVAGRSPPRAASPAVCIRVPSCSPSPRPSFAEEPP